MYYTYKLIQKELYNDAVLLKNQPVGTIHELSLRVGEIKKVPMQSIGTRIL